LVAVTVSGSKLKLSHRERFRYRLIDLYIQGRRRSLNRDMEEINMDRKEINIIVEELNNRIDDAKKIDDVYAADELESFLEWFMESYVY